MRRRFFLFLSFLLMLGIASPCAALDTREAFTLVFPEHRVTGVLKESGEKVRILEAEDGEYFIVLQGAQRRKVAWDALTPSAEPSPALEAVDDRTVAYFAGAMGMKSKTGYLLWTDLSRFLTYVLEYGDEGWQVVRRIPCALGDASHPTPAGSFEVDYKCTSIGKENTYLCRYAMCFYGSYMYHSVLYDWGGERLIDERLGERVSHGCIRLSPEDSRWLYTTVPVG